MGISQRIPIYEVSITHLQGGAPYLAKLVNISTISLGFMGVISIVNADYKLTYNWGGTIL